ncbi:MAG: outer membrane lipoprotein-sorting protein [Thermodesulfobacteriota bacterium]|nr:outer membrane lipoprotein-sorting protein [Thermodesulfobacteriota bacterium]
MKTLFINIFLMVLSLLFLCSYSFAVDKTISDDEKDAMEIIAEVDKIISMIDIKSEQMMTIYRKDGSTRQYRLNIMTGGGDKAFAEIIEPAREQGIQMLRFGEMVWRYLPNIKKPIRISGRQSFMGSDVKDIDILRLNLAEDYISRIVEESHDKYVIELQAKNSSLVYAKSKLWVKQKDFQPIKQEYFSHSGKLVKTVFYRNYRDFEGVKRPAVLEMQSASFPERKTTLELISYRKGVKNPGNIFHRSNLGRIVPKI